MKIRSMRPVRAVAVGIAGLALVLLTAAMAVAPASAQVTQALGSAGKASGGAAVEVPALPEPLTRKAIRDVLSSLSDGQTRELLLRELDRRVAAREAAIAAAAAEDRTLGALLADWGTALGRGWVEAILDTGNMPGNATAALGEFRRGGATPARGGWQVRCFFVSSPGSRRPSPPTGSPVAPRCACTACIRRASGRRSGSSPRASCFRVYSYSRSSPLPSS